MNHLEQSYLEYLMGVVGMTRDQYELAKYLYLYDFYCDTLFGPSDDENRARDGLHLRVDFGGELFADRGEMSYKKCSVLEMLVAFAMRINDEYIGNPSDPHPDEVFAEMLENLGLNSCWRSYRRIGDTATTYFLNITDVREILERWMRRRFDPDGYGSLFPMGQLASRDMRCVSMWDQMQEYVYCFH